VHRCCNSFQHSPGCNGVWAAGRWLADVSPDRRDRKWCLLLDAACDLHQRRLCRDCPQTRESCRQRPSSKSPQMHGADATGGHRKTRKRPKASSCRGLRELHARRCSRDCPRHGRAAASARARRAGKCTEPLAPTGTAAGHYSSWAAFLVTGGAPATARSPGGRRARKCTGPPLPTSREGAQAATAESGRRQTFPTSGARCRAAEWARRRRTLPTGAVEQLVAQCGAKTGRSGEVQHLDAGRHDVQLMATDFPSGQSKPLSRLDRPPTLANAADCGRSVRANTPPATQQTAPTTCCWRRQSHARRCPRHRP